MKKTEYTPASILGRLDEAEEFMSIEVIDGGEFEIEGGGA